MTINTYANMKNSYTIKNIPQDHLEYLDKMNPRYDFTGKMIVFDDGSSYPIISGKHFRRTPVWFARRKMLNGKTFYICSTCDKFILCHKGFIVDYDYLEGR